jgi:hypothetical protein
MPAIRYLATVFLVILLAPWDARSQAPSLIVELEGGPAWQSRNDVEIPNDGSATRFSLIDLLGNGHWPAGRIYVTWNVAERHGIRALLAPLSVTETGVAAEDIRFAGAMYSAGGETTATYTFNSYRLSYRYRLVDGERFTGWIGATAKIRDALVELEQNGTTSRKTDVGFVPLLHLAGDLQFAPRWHLSLDADALAGGPGRAIDAALKIGYDLGEEWSLSAGYRTVEGGADVTEVYNFTWLHYAVLSVSRAFR